MPSKTAAPWEILYAIATDEIKAFPAEVDQVKAERVAKLFGEHVLTIATHAASYEGKSGELGIQESAAKTTTLPLAATKDQILAVACKASSCKVTTSGGAFIYGKWLTLAGKTATVTLTEGMVAFFQSDGTNWVLWGDVLNENKYTAQVGRAFETEFEPSASREALVVLEISSPSGAFAPLFVGGVQITELNTVAGGRATYPFVCPAGQKWKLNKPTGATELKSSYLLR